MHTAQRYGVLVIIDTLLKIAKLFSYAEEGVEPQAFGLPGDQPGPELAQHGMAEARVGQLEAQRIVPVDATAHRVGLLAVGQALGKLQDSREGEAAGCPRAGKNGTQS